MEKKNLAQIIIKYYPGSELIDCPLNDKSMKDLWESIKENETMDGLFDFIVNEIRVETDKNEILRLLNRAISDLNGVMTGIIQDY